MTETSKIYTKKNNNDKYPYQSMCRSEGEARVVMGPIVRKTKKDQKKNNVHLIHVLVVLLTLPTSRVMKLFNKT